MVGRKGKKERERERGRERGRENEGAMWVHNNVCAVRPHTLWTLPCDCGGTRSRLSPSRSGGYSIITSNHLRDLFGYLESEIDYSLDGLSFFLEFPKSPGSTWKRMNSASILLLGPYKIRIKWFQGIEDSMNTMMNAYGNETSGDPVAKDLVSSNRFDHDMGDRRSLLAKVRSFRQPFRQRGNSIS